MPEINKNIHLSYEKMRGQDTLELLKFPYAASRKKTIAAFAKAGVRINTAADLIKLANLHATGQAERGMRLPNGRILAFDAIKVAQGVQLNKADLINALLHFSPEDVEKIKRDFQINHFQT
ncbi:hypothetical protein JYU20_00570 [Bacteroidales bacterium AH-315-I05]|nr:hypothetical protein [Bacteroidales bacterium AH-315-I05]